MDKGQGGIFTRLDYILSNWEFIEEIEINGSQAIIHYASGREKIINDTEMIINLSDIISAFPNLMDKEVRTRVKQMILFGGRKTDIYESADKPAKKPEPAFKTDIKER